MMENSEFRYGKVGRYLGMFFLLPLVMFFLSQLVSLLEPQELIEKFSVGQYPTPWGVAGFAIVASLLLVEMWLFIGMGIFPLTYKIVLSSSSITIQAGNFPGRNLFSKINNSIYYLGEIPYESIQSAEIDSWRPGIAKLIFPNGGQILLPVKSLERSAEFMDILTSKLSTNQVGEGLVKLAQPRRFKILQSIIFTLAFTPTILLLILFGVDNWNPKIWNEELSSWSVLAVSLDSDGTIWANADGDKDDVIVWRLSENSREHWSLPQNVCRDCTAYTVSHNSRNLPIVLDSDEISTIYEWEGGKWNITTLDAYFFFNDLHAVDTQIWGKRNENLIYVDFATDEIVEIPSPADALSNGLELGMFSVSQDGSILAKFSAKGKPVVIYRLEGETWKNLIEFPPSTQWVWDFYQDAQKNVWVLATSRDKSQITVGYSDSLNGTWKWADMELINPDRELAIFNDFAIDARGRIWVSGVYDQRDNKDRHRDFVMAVEWTEEGIKPLVEYTDKNSNLKYADRFVITDDRIWMNNHRLYWIDATTEELPSPLPDWMVWLKDYYDEKFGRYFLVFLGQIFLFVIGVTLEYK
jgi:hypothetical protein